MTRLSSIDVETLLKVILVLIAVWLALEIVGEVLQLTLGLLRFLPELIGLVVLALVVLWLMDRL